MANNEVREFAQSLIRLVRDEAIGCCKRELRDSTASAVALRWKEKGVSEKSKEQLEMVISDSVDTALFYLLHAIDEGLLDIALNTKGRAQINLGESGNSEMAGRYMGSWRSEFSRERVYDDLAEP